MSTDLRPLRIESQKPMVRCFGCGTYHPFGVSCPSCHVPERCHHFDFKRARLRRCSKQARNGTGYCNQHGTSLG